MVTRDVTTESHSVESHPVACLRTKLEERHCAVFISAARGLPSSGLARGWQLLRTSCVCEGRGRGQCAHTVHCPSKCIPEHSIMKKNPHKFFMLTCESIIPEGNNLVKGFNIKSRLAVWDLSKPHGNVIYL